MAAIQAYTKFGVTPTQLHSLLINKWNFPAQYRDCLSEHFLYQYSGTKFSERMKDGSIEVNGINYLVVYRACTPVSAIKSRQLKLSFRKPRKEFGLSAYVIVRIVPEDLLDLPKISIVNMEGA